MLQISGSFLRRARGDYAGRETTIAFPSRSEGRNNRRLQDLFRENRVNTLDETSRCKPRARHNLHAWSDLSCLIDFHSISRAVIASGVGQRTGLGPISQNPASAPNTKGADKAFSGRHFDERPSGELAAVRPRLLETLPGPWLNRYIKLI